MTLLASFARYEFIILITAFAGVITYKFLSGGITTRNLLCEKTTSGRGRVSASRVQLLLVTLAMAFYILSYVVQNRDFPVIETKWLVMLGGSHSVFLGAKGVLSLISSGSDRNQ